MLFTLSLPAFSEYRPSSGQVSNEGTIVLNVTVTDKSGRAVMGLDKAAFAISDNNELQQISYFENVNQPLSVGVVVGMHGSKTEFGRDEESVETVVKLGLRAFIQATHKDNRYFLQTYYPEVKYLSDWTQDGIELINKVGDAQFKGGSLLDACYGGVEKLINEGKQKRVLLVLSDGMNDYSGQKVEGLRRLVRGSDVLIFTIALTPRGSSGSSLNMEGLGFLEKISTDTGGRFYNPKNMSVISDIFALIALELGHQYAVGYKPSNFVDDGKEHRIKLRVTPPTDSAGKPSQLIVRARETYLSDRGLLRRVQ
jgi:VWFA-related protein